MFIRGLSPFSTAADHTPESCGRIAVHIRALSSVRGITNRRQPVSSDPGIFFLNYLIKFSEL